MEIDENGLNAALTASILASRQDMRTLGFTDGSGASWQLNRRVGQDVMLNLSIPKNGNRFRLDILDEDFLQPYDYQNILERSPNHEFALGVRKAVEEVLEFLSKVRIIQGYEKGMDI
jgi:hypothetical protein